MPKLVPKLDTKGRIANTLNRAKEVQKVIKQEELKNKLAKATKEIKKPARPVSKPVLPGRTRNKESQWAYKKKQQLSSGFKEKVD